MFNSVSRVSAVAIALVAIQCAQAQQRLELPPQPEAWLNSVPISKEALRGKGAFLWFFEEDCPRCRGKWPELYALAEKYQGRPIVFIAVNSGNPRAVVQSYARDVGLGWPVIVDPTRQFEKQADVGEISLENITQVVTINGKGRTQAGRWSDLESSVKQALAGASWKVPPDEVPASLRNAWLAIEFNNYPAAAVTVTKAMKSRKQDVSEPATKLYDAVMKAAEPQLSKARKAFESDEKWAAYKNYSELAAKFDGYELPEDVSESIKTLSEDETVERELAAFKLLQLIEKGLANPRAQRGNLKRLEKLIEDHRDTEAATKAAEYIDRLNQE